MQLLLLTVSTGGLVACDSLSCFAMLERQQRCQNVSLIPLIGLGPKYLCAFITGHYMFQSFCTFWKARGLLPVHLQRGISMGIKPNRFSLYNWGLHSIPVFVLCINKALTIDCNFIKYRAWTSRLISEWTPYYMNHITVMWTIQIFTIPDSTTGKSVLQLLELSSTQLFIHITKAKVAESFFRVLLTIF